MLVPIVGANWNNAANAGVFALNVNNWSLNSNNNVGGFDSYSILKYPIKVRLEQRGVESSYKRNLKRGGC